MGTAVSVMSETDATGVERIFESADRTFSLYRPDSELSRMALGQLTLPNASERVRAAYAEALEWRSATGGAFTPHRPDGVIDLNGTVKAMAVVEAGDLLFLNGSESWCINAGGDVLTSGLQPDGTPWSIGVVDPADRSAMLLSLELTGSRRAVATSGNAERGEHIWSAATAAFTQVTVVADDLVEADVLATAIIAGGQMTLEHVTSHWDVDVVTVDRFGELRATQGLLAALRA